MKLRTFCSIYSVKGDVYKIKTNSSKVASTNMTQWLQTIKKSAEYRTVPTYSSFCKSQTQCCRSRFGSIGSVCFWASRIRISHYLYGIGYGSFHHQVKKGRKTFVYMYCFVTLFLWRMMKMYLEKVKSKKKGIFVDILKVTNERAGSGSVPKCHGSQQCMSR